MKYSDRLVPPQWPNERSVSNWRRADRDDRIAGCLAKGGGRWRCVERFYSLFLRSHIRVRPGAKELTSEIPRSPLGARIVIVIVLGGLIGLGGRVGLLALAPRYAYPTDSFGNIAMGLTAEPKGLWKAYTLAIEENPPIHGKQW